MNCAKCYTEKHCKTNNGKHMPNCPTMEDDFADKCQAYYDIYGDREFLLESLRNVADGYDTTSGKKVPCKNRLEDILNFCHRMNYKKIGIAFCTALEDEALLLDSALRKNGFETISAICKVGGIKKEDVGLEPEGKIIPQDVEITCNPAGQAYVMNEANTDFNIVVGLCIGHDSIFLKASDAPCTVFIVKDRVLGHNPKQSLE